MAEGFLLSAADRDLVRMLAREEAHKILSNLRRDTLADTELQPGFFVARTPVAGIPAMRQEAGTGTGSYAGTGTLTVDADEPGSALCSIYRIPIDAEDEGTPYLELVGQSRRVNNLGAEVAGSKYVFVNKDNFGSWWVIDSSVTLDDYLLNRVTNVCVDFDAQTVSVEHTITRVLSGEVLARYCVPAPSGCCDDGGGVDLGCCPDVELPLTLCGTFGTASGGTSSLSGTQITFTYGGPDNPAWFADGLPACYDAEGNLVRPFLFCDGASFVLSWATPPGVAALSVACDPLEITFSVPNEAGRCDFGAWTTIPLTVVGGPCSGTGSGPSGVVTGCCPAGLPETLHVVVADLMGGCECLAGTYPVVWDGSAWVSTGYSLCGQSVSFSLTCDEDFPPGFVATLSCGASVTTTSKTTGSGCDLPLHLGDEGVSGDCCTGFISLTLTE